MKQFIHTNLNHADYFHGLNEFDFKKIGKPQQELEIPLQMRQKNELKI